MSFTHRNPHPSAAPPLIFIGWSLIGIASMIFDLDSSASVISGFIWALISFSLAKKYDPPRISPRYKREAYERYKNR
jgi:hypothetical protein